MGDVVARYWRQQGYDVLHPIGWDSFGLPAENAAIKRNAHPSEWTYANIDTQAAVLQALRASPSTGPAGCTPRDPEYYRWTQWLFLRFYERGLAYRKDSPGQLVPQGPDGAGQRAGGQRRVRALRHPGDQEER